MRWKWVFTSVVLLAIALMATAYAVLANYDYNKLKPHIARMVKDATGREFNLRGDVDFTIGYPPALVVTNVTFANAPWGSKPQMITVDELRMEMRLLPLLVRKVVLHYLGLAGVEVLLETDSNGKGNWDFLKDRRSGNKAATRRPLRIDIGRISVKDLRLVYQRGKAGPAAHYNIDRLDVARDDMVERLAIDLQARYNEQPVAVSGRTGLIRDLGAPQHFPVTLAGTYANAKVAVDGAIDDLLHLQGIELKAHVSGTDLTALGLGKALPLPETHAFDATGLLKGSKEALALEDLQGTFSGRGIDLVLSGNVGNLFAFSAVDLKLNGSGKDLSTIGPIIGQDLPVTDQFAFHGHLRGTAKNLSFQEAQASASRGGLKIGLDGEVKDLPGISGLDLQIEGSGKNLAEMAPIIGVKLPSTDEFAVEGRLKGSTKVLRLEAAQGRVRKGRLNLTLNGLIGDLRALNGVDLKVEGRGADLAKVGKMIDVQLPATDEFAAQGRLKGSGKNLSLAEVRASANRGNVKVVFAGAVKDLLNFSGLDLQIEGSGNNLAEIGGIFDVKLPATDKFKIQGRLTGSAETLSLQEARASAKRGALDLKLSGGVDGLLAGTTVDLDLNASGAELAEIGPLVGAELPEMGSFAMTAHLSGSEKAVSLDGFSASVDKSDFKGQATVAFLERPRISARLASSVIDFTRLMKHFEQDEKTPADRHSPPRRLFPNTALPLDVLKKVDADIVIKARNIRARDARLEFGHLTVKLDNADFSIERLEATYKKTKLAGHLDISDGAPPQVAFNFLVQGFNLGDFIRETGRSETVEATVDIAAYGKSRGSSVDQLMANLNGAIGAVMGKGYLSRYLNMLSLNLSQKVLSFWDWARRHREKADQINCAVVQFDIKEGVATSKAFVFDSQLAVLTGEGEINLGTEQIDFLLVPDTKDPSLSLSTNLRVRGALMDPQVRPDKLSLLTQGGWALSSLAIGPVGLLAPFVHLGAHKAHPCDVPGIGQLEHQASPRRDNAPP